MAKRGPKNSLSVEHKAAMAQGRSEGRVVRDYLDALRANKPKRGRKRTPDTVNKRLKAIDDELLTADAISELRLLQERRNLSDELSTMGGEMDISVYEDAFVRAAGSYSQRHGIAYTTWREIGVPASVLSKAGVSRSSN
ncbi:MAG: hypothetical protein H0U21_09980 [Acidimicrobiia bacterium]|nr:hypothetical protein [Acidimicrobiia bacterium]